MPFETERGLARFSSLFGIFFLFAIPDFWRQSRDEGEKAQHNPTFLHILKYDHMCVHIWFLLKREKQGLLAS